MTAFVDVGPGLVLRRRVGGVGSTTAAADLPDTPDTSLDPAAAMVAAAQEGDRAAIEALITWLRPAVVRYCRARIGRGTSFASADDVAQETFAAVLTALPSYRSRGPSFLSFVFGIATHKITDFHRKNARDRTTPVDDVPEATELAAGPEERALRTEAREGVRALLAELSPMQREVVTLRLIVGLSVSETAAAVEATPGAVRVCQHRALAKLRARLQESVLTSCYCSPG